MNESKKDCCNAVKTAFWLFPVTSNRTINNYDVQYNTIRLLTRPTSEGLETNWHIPSSMHSSRRAHASAARARDVAAAALRPDDCIQSLSAMIQSTGAPEDRRTTLVRLDRA